MKTHGGGCPLKNGKETDRFVTFGCISAQIYTGFRFCIYFVMIYYKKSVFCFILIDSTTALTTHNTQEAHASRVLAYFVTRDARTHAPFARTMALRMRGRI